MGITAQAGPDQSWDAVTSPRSSPSVRGPKQLGHAQLPSQAQEQGDGPDNQEAGTAGDHLTIDATKYTFTIGFHNFTS